MSYRPLPCNFAPGSLSDSTVLLLGQTVLIVNNVEAIVYFLGKRGFVSSIVSRTQEIWLPFVAMCESEWIRPGLLDLCLQTRVSLTGSGSWPKIISSQPNFNLSPMYESY
jgi:hypothetical protein